MSDSPRGIFGWSSPGRTLAFLAIGGLFALIIVGWLLLPPCPAQTLPACVRALW